jgi:hypothetical protein
LEAEEGSARTTNLAPALEQALGSALLLVEALEQPRPRLVGVLPALLAPVEDSELPPRTKEIHYSEGKTAPALALEQATHLVRASSEAQPRLQVQVLVVVLVPAVVSAQGHQVSVVHPPVVAAYSERQHQQQAAALAAQQGPPAGSVLVLDSALAVARLSAAEQVLLSSKQSLLLTAPAALLSVLGLRRIHPPML